MAGLDAPPPRPAPPSPAPSTADRRAATAGWLGAALVLSAYIANTQGWVAAQHPLFLAANMVGAAAIGLSAWRKRAWPAFAIEAAWALISLGALARALL